GNIYGYIHLYDALRLYATAVRLAMNVTGNPNIYKDGRYIWNKMRRLTFPGLVSAAGVSSGTVMMDDIAERAPVYAVKKVNEIEPKLIDNCDGVKTNTGCFDLKITNLMTGFWPSPDGALPKEEPACGFRNERCDYTLIICAGVLLFVLVCSVVTALIMVRVCENRALAKMPWRIYRDDFRVINEDEARSMDIIYNKDVVLDAKFHGAFIRDITLGLEYLHSSTIGFHGSLTPWACLIDRNWMVKLTDFGIADSLERWEKQGLIATETLKEGILYQPPEALRNREENRIRRADQVIQLEPITSILLMCFQEISK
ncbi:hypothetical protein TELCIR_16737, partial [Teladorsagia circumcincta]